MALCKLQNVFPRSLAQFAYRFQCFLLNQVRPCLNVLIFIFWSFTLLRERSGLVCVQLGFPPSKVHRYPKMFDVIPSLPHNSGVVCDSPSTCLSENQYIWVPESCLSLLGRQMLGSDYNLVPRAFPLENGRSAKALGTRIKLTAKTVHEDPASCKRWISRKEI